jgi:very-short-patch-repair endonuclease
MVEARWRQVAAGQSGLMSTRQLDDSGVSAFRRQQLVEQGGLEHRGRGLWALPGWSEDYRRRLWEAVLRAGPGAVVFRRSAAVEWGMDGVDCGPAELALPPGHHSRLQGVHRLGSLLPIDVIRREGLPVTTVARTLADLGSAETPAVVERATEWALRNDLVTVTDLDAITQRLTKSGARGLATVLARRPLGAPPTESDAETLFVQLARDLGYPDPVRQYPVLLRGRRFRIDFAWPGLRLAVEIDGAVVHGPDELPSDLLRQNRIVLDGWMILRFTWGMLRRGRHRIEDDLGVAWSLRGGLIPSR